jgi:hypothetical protein
VTEFDGAEAVRMLEIEVIVRDRTYHVRLPAAEFLRMEWPITRCDANAAVAGGTKARDGARVAIQLLSAPTRTRVHSFTGWHRGAERQWMYLHAGGAIGGDAAVRIEPGSGNLHLLELPAPLAGPALAEGVLACLELAFCGPPALTVPIFAAPWRAALGQTHTAVYIQAEPEVGKTTAALWAQNHFATGYHMKLLPETWESTAFGLNASLATAGDCVLLVDDFTWQGGDADDKQRKKLSDVIRPLFGGTSRTKGTADSRTRRDRRARALPIITGEALPKGDSLLSRMVALTMGEPLPLSREQINLYDQRAAGGVYAGTMAAFVAWLAPRYEAMRAALPARVEKYAAILATESGKPRAAREVAELAVGLRTFLKFAVEVGALPLEHAREAWDAARAALAACARAQAETQADESAVAKFFGYVRAALASGAAHLVGKDGDVPPRHEACGWHRASDVEAMDREPVRRPSGVRVGYTDGDTVWLIRDAAVSVAKQIAKTHGEPLQVDARGLTDRLFARGLLTKVELNPDKTLKSKTVRLQVAGTPHGGLWHLAAATVWGEPGDD